MIFPFGGIDVFLDGRHDHHQNHRYPMPRSFRPSAAWTIHKDWNDIAKLKVTVGFRSVAGNGSTGKNVRVWQVTNVGKRSVFLTHTVDETEPKPNDNKGFGSFNVNDPQLPKRLEAGDYHMSLYPGVRQI
jgi:hypothetical protein